MIFYNKEKTVTIVIKGIAANDPYASAIKFKKNATKKQTPGNKEAVNSIVLIQFLPN